MCQICGSKRLGCSAGCQEVSWWIWRIHYVQVTKKESKRSAFTLKNRADATRNRKQGFQCPNKKDWLKKKSVHNWKVYTTKIDHFHQRKSALQWQSSFLAIHKVGKNCHFWKTSNGNKLETVKTQINFNANLHLSWHFEFKLKWLIPLSNLFSNLRNTKMPTLPNLCIAGKLVWETIRSKFSHWLLYM